MLKLTNLLFLEENHKKVPQEPVDYAAVLDARRQMADNCTLPCFMLLPTSLSCCLPASSAPCPSSLPFAICISLVDLSVGKLKGSPLSRDVREFGSWDFGDPAPFQWIFSKLSHLGKILHLIFLFNKLKTEKYLLVLNLVSFFSFLWEF